MIADAQAILVLAALQLFDITAEILLPGIPERGVLAEYDSINTHVY